MDGRLQYIDIASNFPIHGEESARESEVEAQENDAVNDGGQHVQSGAPSLDIGAGNDEEMPIQSGGPGFAIRAVYDEERPAVAAATGFAIGAGNDGVWRGNGGEPQIGVGVEWMGGNGGDSPMQVGAPVFEIGAVNDAWEAVEGFGIDVSLVPDAVAPLFGNFPATDQWSPAQSAVREMPPSASGFSDFSVFSAGWVEAEDEISNEEAVQGAVREMPPSLSALSGFSVFSAGWVEAEDEISNEEAVQGAVEEMPPSPSGFSDFSVFSAGTWMEAEDEISNEEAVQLAIRDFTYEISGEEAVNGVPEILERVCESIEIDDLAVQQDELCAICIHAFNHVVDDDNENVNGNRTLHRLPCSHLFHSHCISQWLHRKLYCPLSRNPLRQP